MSPNLDTDTLRIALPKGRMQAAILDLMADAGLAVAMGSRAYRPTITTGRFNAKILKPQNIVEMLVAGSRDVGFAGADWVAEQGADLVELLDTGFDPVRLVAAAPAEILVAGALPKRRLRVATEYPATATRWINESGLDATLVRTFGATEVFPPDDADVIVDNTATGATLAANGLTEIAILAHSSTRLYANRAALAEPSRRAAIEGLVMLLRSVLEARQRVMLEVNVSVLELEAVCALLPCMREPTIASLHDNCGFAVKAAVARNLLPTLVPLIKRAGGTDIVISVIAQIVA